jgi:RES domain
MAVPVDFANRQIILCQEDVSRLMRIFKPRPPKPSGIYYGANGTNRFDCPKKSFGVMYAAFDLATCIAETITREQNRNPLYNRSLAVSQAGEVDVRSVAILQASRPLRLIDATDVGLYNMGAEAGEFNSVDYPNTTQPWALELFNRPESADGILYRSRFLNNRKAVAIFERGGDNVSIFASQMMALARHPGFLHAVQELNICLLP